MFRYLIFLLFKLNILVSNRGSFKFLLFLMEPFNAFSFQSWFAFNKFQSNLYRKMYFLLQSTLAAGRQEGGHILIVTTPSPATVALLMQSLAEKFNQSKDVTAVGSTGV